jgi:hypothetical protein
MVQWHHMGPHSVSVHWTHDIFQDEHSQYQFYNLLQQQLAQVLEKVYLFKRTKPKKNYKKTVLTQFTAIKVSIASISRFASANASVAFGLTISISSTLAWINTLLIATSECIMAFWIIETFIGFTLYIWTAFVTRRTLASGSVTTSRASSFSATLFKGAWILTLSLNASLCQWTFIITLTTS